jgi:alpha-glucosidase (family GH31 glycosyl hydrolase)
MFVRGGAIIPMGPDLKFVGEKPVDPITFAIYPDEKGSASTTLYEDDGISPAYLSGKFSRTLVSINRAGNTYVANLSGREGSYNPGARRFDFVIKGTAKSATINDDGRARSVAIQ